MISPKAAGLIKCMTAAGGLVAVALIAGAVSDMWQDEHKEEATFWLLVIIAILLAIGALRNFINDLREGE